MKYREVQLVDDRSIADSGTETIDLNLQDPITDLIVRFRAVQAAALDDTPPQKNITKIEIVDGGQVYWSLSGPQAVAATAYGLGRYPNCWIDGRAGSGQRMNFHLLFGRYIGDEEFSFDPRRLLNPQLKVTWADVAGYTNGSLTLGITARIMENALSPAKCLMWKEVEAWNTASEGEHVVDLPVNLPIRALMHRCYVAGNLWGTIHSRFKLDCDMGKFIPFDLATSEYEDIVKSFMGPFSFVMHGVYSNAEWVECWLGTTLGCSLVDIASYGIANGYTAGAWSWFVAYIRDNAGAEMTDRLMEALVTGYFPECCVLYPFGRWNDPETWFKASAYKGVQFKITETTADAAASVCIQQPRTLP